MGTAIETINEATYFVIEEYDVNDVTVLFGFTDRPPEVAAGYARNQRVRLVEDIVALRRDRPIYFKFCGEDRIEGTSASDIVRNIKAAKKRQQRYRSQIRANHREKQVASTDPLATLDETQMGAVEEFIMRTNSGLTWAEGDREDTELGSRRVALLFRLMCSLPPADRDLFGETLLLAGLAMNALAKADVSEAGR